VRVLSVHRYAPGLSACEVTTVTPWLIISFGAGLTRLVEVFAGRWGPGS
jgi:hypothetical protein